MRNLKKVLSLVLCMAMMLSVMVVGAGAAFKDQEKIVNDEAVDMCVALNIINGYTDGSYRPEGNVTRAEMCKMICIALNGGKEPATATKVVPTYSDIDGHWAEGYIEYCNTKGIVAGVGGGKFNPNGNVTGSQAAKMLLVALGYNADVEKYTGASWELYVNVQANQDGLYTDLETMDPSAALSRDNAAQMIWNALGAVIINKSSSIDRVTGDIIDIYEKDKNDTDLLEKTYGVYCVEGIVVGNEYVTLADNVTGSAAMKEGKTSIEITNAESLTGKLNISDNKINTFEVSTGADEIGKAVTIFVKPDSTSKATTKATVIGNVVTTGNTVMTADGKWTNQTKMNTALKDAGLKTAMPGAYYVNGVKANEAMTNALMKNGYVTQFIDNTGDDIVDYVLVNKVDFGKVAAYSTKDDGAITISTSGAAVKYTDSADVVGFDKVAKNDYVLYSEVGGTLYVEKATSVTGKLTDYGTQGVDGGEKNLWVDGTKYTNSGASAYLTGLISPIKYQTLDEEGTFYFDACGYIVAIDGAVTKHYAVATYYNANAYSEGSITTAARAQVTFEDNQSGAPVVSSATASALASTLSNTNYADDVQLGSYTYNSDDELVLNTTGLKTIPVASTSQTTTSATFKYTSGNILVSYNGSNLQENSKNVYMTDDTVVFVIETKDGGAIDSTQVDKVATYVGKDNVPSMELSGNNYVVKYMVNSDNEITAMAVISGKVLSVTDNYMYIIKVVSSATNTKKVLAVIDGEVKEITVNSKSATTLTGTMFEYAVDADGNYDLKSIIGKTDSDLIEQVNTNKHTIVVNGVEYKVTDGTDIANVDDEEAIDFDELQKGDYVTVYYNTDRDEVLGIYVHEAFDPSNNNILAYGAPVTYVGGNYQVAAGTDAASVIAALTTSGGSIAKITNDSGDVTGELSAGNYKIVVTSETGSTAAYNLVVEGETTEE